MNDTRNFEKKFFAKIPAAAENTAVFAVGAAAYFAVELMWRGHSHATMFFAGGLCFLIIYCAEKKFSEFPLLLRCACYALMITAVELAFGVVFNIVLGMGVWDYSTSPMNFYGQICPAFSLLWFGISFPAVYLCSVIRRLSAVLYEKSTKS